MSTEAASKATPVSSAPPKQAAEQFETVPQTPTPNTINPQHEADKARMQRIRDAVKKPATEAPPAKPDAPAPDAAAKPPADVKPPVSIFEKPAKADAPATTAVPEADPVDAMTLPANAAPESVVRFKDLAKVAKERKIATDAALKKAADLEAQLAQRNASAPAETAETQRLREEHKAAMDKLAIVSLKDHPDFAKQYVEPKKKALAAAAEVIAYNDKGNPELAALLSKPMKEFNAAVSEFVKDMNSADATTVVSSLRQARDLHLSEQAALSQGGELQKNLQAKAALEQKRAFEAVAADVVPAFTKREITDTMTPEQKQEATTYNQSVETLRNRAEARAFKPVTERDVATMAFKEAAYDHIVEHAVPYLERHVSNQAAIIADLTAQLTALRGGRGPNPGGDPAAAGAEPDMKKWTIDQRVAFRLHGRRP